MNKRDFLKTSLAFSSMFLIDGTKMASAQEKVLEFDGVSFGWTHHGDRLAGVFTAPTSGWIAIGFNNEPILQNTHFVIAAVSAAPVRIEEHIAIVPNHRRVEELGRSPALLDAEGHFENGVSSLSFAVPHDFPGRPELKLAPGNDVSVMLAWSREADFDHHSAWRRQVAVVL